MYPRLRLHAKLKGKCAQHGGEAKERHHEKECAIARVVSTQIKTAMGAHIPNCQ
jgi:hypothetical protein